MDVHWRNVMVGPDDEIYLIDFGFARKYIDPTELQADQGELGLIFEELLERCPEAIPALREIVNRMTRLRRTARWPSIQHVQQQLSSIPVVA
jgi:hypothetical protein